MDFRIYLQDELASRCQHNPRYSLRAFAQSLGIGSSDLSKLIRQKRRLTDATIVRLAMRLGVEAEQMEAFRSALRSSKRRAKVSKDDAASDYSAKQLSLDTFRMLGDWYHLAILELIKIDGFQPNEKWIAKRLGLTVSEVNIAVQRLMRLGMLEIDAAGVWLDRVGATTSINDEYTHAARQKLQRQILEKATEALGSVPFLERDQSAILMAVNRANLPAAKELIREFRRRLCELLEAGTPKEQIYYLSVSLFPILKPESIAAKGQ